MFNYNSTISDLNISIVSLIVLLFFTNCYERPIASKKEKERTITVVVSLPFIHPQTGKQEFYLDSLSLFYIDSFTIYKIPYQDELVSFVTDTHGNIIGEQLQKVIKKNAYYIFENNLSFGIYFDSASSSFGQKISTDSFYKTKSAFHNTLYRNSNDSLVESQNISNSILLEKYIPKTKFDQSYADTLLLYYSDKFRNIDYSFSKTLEIQKQKKIYKARLVFAENKERGEYTDELKKELTFEIKENFNYDRKEIYNMLQKYIKLNKSSATK